jgi:rubrerythrin
MPNFTDPFPGIREIRPMSVTDLIRALRLDLSAEEEAVHLYTAHAESTDNGLARKVLLDVADEERVHAGEFLKLIELLDPDETKHMKSGAVEVENFKSFAEGWRR